MIDFLKDKKSYVSLVDRMMADSALKTVNAARCSYDFEKDEFDEKDQRLTIRHVLAWLAVTRGMLFYDNST